MGYPEPKNPTARWALDMIERGVRAYASAWVAIYVAGNYVLDAWNASAIETFKAAFFALVVSALFSLAGKRQGAEDSASFLPPNTDPPQ